MNEILRKKKIWWQSSENSLEVKRICLKVLDFKEFTSASSSEISSTITLLSTLEADGMKENLFNKNLALPYEKSTFIESVFEPLNLKGKDFYSTPIQSAPDKKELSRSETKIEKHNTTNWNDLTKFYLKNDVLLFTKILKAYIYIHMNLPILLIRFICIAPLLLLGRGV